ncbi:MAG: hypothetical protein M3N28_10385 [Actinomycetota bacterium]|nr:hypothetical protein [Actinomycetota bacterium]
MRFLDVFIHQAHPGEDRHRYTTFEQKMAGAREYKEQEALPWPVLVDDLAGTMHEAYSQGMADPTFLIDADGRVAFYGMWTHAPTLDRAISELLGRGGRGQAGGLDRTPHLLASFVDGYRGPRRGGRRAVLEYDLGAGGAGSLSFLGNKAKRLLGPVALRSTPLPKRTRLAIGLGFAAFVLLIASLVAAVFG